LPVLQPEISVTGWSASALESVVFVLE